MTGMREGEIVAIMIVVLSQWEKLDPCELREEGFEKFVIYSSFISPHINVYGI